MRSAWVEVLAIVVASSACTPIAVREQFARHSGCEEDKIETREELTDMYTVSVYRASGCGRSSTFYCRQERCVSPEYLVTQRHSRQFDCSPGEVTAEYLNGYAWKASGCGHDLTYQCVHSWDYVMVCVAETADEGRKARNRD